MKIINAYFTLALVLAIGATQLSGQSRTDIFNDLAQDIDKTSLDFQQDLQRIDKTDRTMDLVQTVKDVVYTVNTELEKVRSTGGSDARTATGSVDRTAKVDPRYVQNIENLKRDLAETTDQMVKVYQDLVNVQKTNISTKVDSYTRTDDRTQTRSADTKSKSMDGVTAVQTKEQRQYEDMVNMQTEKVKKICADLCDAIRTLEVR